MSDFKVPDSGMPEESYWNQLMDIPAIVDWLELERVKQGIVEIGCGYGSFTLPIAQQCSAPLIAFDIEPAMINLCQAKCAQAQLDHVQFVERDIIHSGSGLATASMDLVLIFNLLHGPHNLTLIREAQRILSHEGRIAIIHWRGDIETPRGPALDTRPDLDSIQQLTADLPLELAQLSPALGPYHWGLHLLNVLDE